MSTENYDNYDGHVWVESKSIEGLKSDESLFSKGMLLPTKDSDKCRVKINNEIYEIPVSSIQKANPIQFDYSEDMASLTYLNEPSVINNLNLRYQKDQIYTWSGLFLVAVNPYKMINIYDTDSINKYSIDSNITNNDKDNHKSSNNEEIDSSKQRSSPHIFATAQEAFKNLIKEHKNQSILVTGESGAGKTENTKKVIQYILSVSTSDKNKQHAKLLESQIIEANPILESFGNATTVRNLNSSRFGKFVKINIDPTTTELIGAHIDWYLLEKSRVILQDSNERNYHIFYQLLKGADGELLTQLGLTRSIKDYQYLSNGKSTINGIDDQKDFKNLQKSFEIMKFGETDIENIFKTLASILHLGNIKFKNMQNDRQANLNEESELIIEKISNLLNVSSKEFKKSILTSKINVGREVVSQERTAAQAKFAIDALAKTLYEKLFKFLMDKINNNFSQNSANNNPLSNNYVGILDIAGFEIFDKNSFEQLCINYTNEKLQQFFNHHMFVLEQQEYKKEGIEWDYIDFGNELKPTIELIENTNSGINKSKAGILALLDEECVVPKGGDKSFLDKLYKELELPKGKIGSFRPNKLRDGFIVKHYAGEVNYSVDNWIDKNKDPLSQSMIELLSNSKSIFISEFFELEIENYYSNSPTKSPVKNNNLLSSPRKKSSLFRTVAQRHKQQLINLMDQLNHTHPHFVRCILPNAEKKSNLFNEKLVLDQLRCNGVLEGIRIARSGYPNRLEFDVFVKYYGILGNINIKRGSNNEIFKQQAQLLLHNMDPICTLDKDAYKVGLTKLFFRNGVLAKLEKVREEKITSLVTNFNSLARGSFARTQIRQKLIRLKASKVVSKNLESWIDVKSDPWFKLIKTVGDSAGIFDSNTLNDGNSKSGSGSVVKIIEQKWKNKVLALESELTNANNELVEEKDKLSMVNLQLNEIQKNFKVNKELIKSKENEIIEINSTIDQLNNDLKSANKKIEKLDSQLSDEQSNKFDFEKYQSDLAKEKIKSQQLEKQLALETKSVIKLTEQLDQFKSQVGEKERELKTIQVEKGRNSKDLKDKISNLVCDKSFMIVNFFFILTFTNTF